MDGASPVTRAPAIHLTLPAALLQLYREHEGPYSLPTLTELLERAARQELDDAGIEVPPRAPPSPQTSAATRARIQRRRDRRAEGT